MDRLIQRLAPLMILLGAALPAAATTWYVTMEGDDAQTGLGPDPERALRTPAAGLARLRPGDTLLLGEGEYLLAEPLRIGAELSGTAQQPTRIAAAPGETVALTGLRPLTGFEPAGGGLYRAPWAGSRPELVTVDGQPQILARYPNWIAEEPYTSGWAYAAAEPVPAETLAAVGAKRAVRVRPEDRRRWTDPTLGRMSIFSGHEWWNNLVPIAGWDPAEGVLTLTADCSYDIVPEDRYFVEGLPEELDAPGEWCLSADGDHLLYYPLTPQPPTDLRVSRPGGLLRIDQAAHVVIEGLALHGCEATAITLSGATDCRVSDCRISQVGGYHGAGAAVYGGARNVVEGCLIEDVGGAGLQLAGGDPLTRSPAGNRAENNLIRRVGRVYKQGAGISVSGVGNVVERNTIHDVPRWAIGFGGTDHLIELNELYNVSLETSDTGAIYGGSLNWLSSHGIVIRRNYIHDVVGRGRRNGEWRAPFYAWGIYLDWSAMGVTVEQNVIEGTPRSGIMVHDGRFNTLRNNLIVDCGGGAWDDGSQIELSGWHTQHFFWLRGLELGWVKQYESVLQQPSWHTPASTLRDPRQTALPDGRTMHSNTVERNILVWQQPRAKAIHYRNADYAANPSDRNLVWHHGQPILTGVRQTARLRGPNLVPNPGLEPAETGPLPRDWASRIPWDGCSATLEDGAVRMVGKASAALAERPTWERQVAVFSRMIGGLRPGGDYGLTVHLRAAEANTQARMEAISYRGGAYDVRFAKEYVVGPERRPYEVAFRFPQPGDANWRDGMLETFYVRVILSQDDGELWLDEPVLREAVLMDEWEAWQAAGQDRHSIVADPLFVEAGAPWRGLRPDSPAWALGWEPIVLEGLGSDRRDPQPGQP